MTDTRNLLLTPQTVIGYIGMAIGGGVVAAVMMWGDPQTKSQTIGQVLTIMAMIVGFYFGSSSGSQAKDETIARRDQPPPTTTTVSAPPATVTTITGNPP
jgi:hypothetical protein